MAIYPAVSPGFSRGWPLSLPESGSPGLIPRTPASQWPCQPASPRPKDHPVHTCSVNQVAQGFLAVGQAVIVELPQIGAGGLLDVDPSFRTHLPAPVHATNAVTGVAAAMGQADFQVGALVHNPPKDKGGEGNRPVYQV